MQHTKMDMVTQKDTIKVTNFDELLENCNVKQSRHGCSLPNRIRALICGPSGCGKTNVMLSLLLDPNGLRFKNIYLFCKTLEQPKYRYLNNVLMSTSVINLHTYKDSRFVPLPQEVKPHSVFIFDDVSCDNQDRIRSYFCLGRHYDIDSFYLSQSYAKVPKHLIRDNLNFLVVFKQDTLNIRRLYEDHVNSDMSYESFFKMCRKVWSINYGFLVIDKTKPLNKGRYREQFHKFIKCVDNHNFRSFD